MNTTDPAGQEKPTAPAEDTLTRIDDGEVRARVERLFRRRGDSTVMRLLEQAVLAYRLEQRR